MPQNGFLIKHHSQVLGTEKNVFVFRRLLDATVVKQYIYPELKVSPINNKVHFFMKKDQQLETLIEAVDFEMFYHKTRINSLQINLIDDIIDKNAKVFLIGSMLYDDRKLEEEDIKRNIEYIFKNK